MARSLIHDSHATTRWLLLAAAAVALGCGSLAAEPSVKAPPAPSAPATSQKREKSDSKKSEPAAGEKWVRVLTDAKGKPLAMQTAIVRYVKANEFKPGKRANE